MRKQIDTALLIAALTAVLYSFTTIYYRAYFNVFSLDPDMLERGFHQNIFDGLMLSFGQICTYLLVITSILYSYSHQILPCYIDFVRKRWRIKRKLIKFRRFWYGKRIESATEKSTKTVFRYFFIATVVIISYLFIMAYFERQGKSAGEKLMQMHESQSPDLTVISVTINGRERKLTLLGCGARNCAGIAKKTNRIFYFPESIGFSYIYKKK